MSFQGFPDVLQIFAVKICKNKNPAGFAGNLHAGQRCLRPTVAGLWVEVAG